MMSFIMLFLLNFHFGSKKAREKGIVREQEPPAEKPIVFEIMDTELSHSAKWLGVFVFLRSCEEK
ncbi:Uncharacterised protein [Bacillus tequilensis]|nr:Uncharacterised protein [Bacillus tequilensis]